MYLECEMPKVQKGKICLINFDDVAYLVPIEKENHYKLVWKGEAVSTTEIILCQENYDSLRKGVTHVLQSN